MSKLKMKTTATLLIAIFMISAFAVAIPVNAFTTYDYEQAILDAADRIILGQNNDGGFDWVLSLDPSGTSCVNLGISAFGVLKAYKLDPRPEFELSLAEAYMYALDHPPTWIQDGELLRWKEKPNGVNSWPDVTFILELAREAAQDPSLLAEIVECVPETTVSDMAAFAKSLWDDRVNHMGNDYPTDTGGSVTDMAVYLRDARAGLPGIVPWDIEEAVKAALALEDYYSETDYGLQATELAEFIHDYIYGTTDYFDINDRSEICYTIGLTGALEAFTEAGVYSVEASEIKDLLIDYQKTDGSWQESDSDPECIVQPTAYAIMALLAQGDLDAEVSANLGVEWLIGAQTPTVGGWLNSENEEYPEVDSEAAWALFRFSSLLKSNFVPGKGKGLDKPIPNDNFAKGRGPHHGPNENANENAHEHAHSNSNGKGKGG